MEANGTLAAMLKKEASAIRRQMACMHRGFEAMLEVDNLPDALFIVDVNYEDIAVMKANCLHIPIIAVVDTNSDPTHITRMILVNDDSTKSGLFLETGMEAITIGQAASDAKQMDSRRRKNIISNEEMAGVDARTMDVALTSEAEEVMHKDKEVAIASREKPTVIQRRHSRKKVEEKSEEKSEKTME